MNFIDKDLTLFVVGMFWNILSAGSTCIFLLFYTCWIDMLNNTIGAWHTVRCVLINSNTCPRQEWLQCLARSRGRKETKSWSNRRENMVLSFKFWLNLLANWVENQQTIGFKHAKDRWLMRYVPWVEWCASIDVYHIKNKMASQRCWLAIY